MCGSNPILFQVHWNVFHFWNYARSYLRSRERDTVLKYYLADFPKILTFERVQFLQNYYHESPDTKNYHIFIDGADVLVLLLQSAGKGGGEAAYWQLDDYLLPKNNSYRSGINNQQ